MATAAEEPVVAEIPAEVEPESNDVKAEEPKPKKAAAPRKRSPSTHPPFLEMISEAIVTLKEKTGSSQYAIQKFMEEKHKQLPPNLRKLLLVQLKRLVASGKLVKVKNSYKIPAKAAAAAPTAPVKKPAASKAKTVAKPKAAAKPKAKPAAKAKTVAKPKPKAKAAAKPKPAPKPKAKVAPKPKPAAKPKAKAAAKPKPAAAKPKAAATTAKRKAPEKPKAKPPAKAAKTSAKASPAKKVAKPKKSAPAKKPTRATPRKTLRKK